MKEYRLHDPLAIPVVSPNDVEGKTTHLSAAEALVLAAKMPSWKHDGLYYIGLGHGAKVSIYKSNAPGRGAVGVIEVKKEDLFLAQHEDRAEGSKPIMAVLLQLEIAEKEASKRKADTDRKERDREREERKRAAIDAADEMRKRLKL